MIRSELSISLTPFVDMRDQVRGIDLDLEVLVREIESAGADRVHLNLRTDSDFEVLRKLSGLRIDSKLSIPLEVEMTSDWSESEALKGFELDRVCLAQGDDLERLRGCLESWRKRGSALSLHGGPHLATSEALKGVGPIEVLLSGDLESSLLRDSLPDANQGECSFGIASFDSRDRVRSLVEMDRFRSFRFCGSIASRACFVGIRQAVREAKSDILAP